jgi:hypothetical protein
MEKKSFSAEYRTRDSNRSLILPVTSCSKESNCNRDLKSPFQPLLIPLLCSVAAICNILPKPEIPKNRICFCWCVVFCAN